MKHICLLYNYMGQVVFWTKQFWRDFFQIKNILKSNSATSAPINWVYLDTYGHNFNCTILKNIFLNDMNYIRNTFFNCLFLYLKVIYYHQNLFNLPRISRTKGLQCWLNSNRWEFMRQHCLHLNLIKTHIFYLNCYRQIFKYLVNVLLFLLHLVMLLKCLVLSFIGCRNSKVYWVRWWLHFALCSVW